MQENPRQNQSLCRRSKAVMKKLNDPKPVRWGQIIAPPVLSPVNTCRSNTLTGACDDVVCPTTCLELLQQRVKTPPLLRHHRILTIAFSYQIYLPNRFDIPFSLAIFLTPHHC